MRFFVHDAEILRLTARHNVNHDEIYELGSIAGDVGKARDRALADRGRGAVVEYWRVFLHDFLSGAVDVDADGIFALQLSLEGVDEM